MALQRRRILATGGVVMTGGLLGCIDRADSPDDGMKTVQTSFYLLSDVAQAVTGKDLAVESVVPFGQHGHGWDGPTAGQQRDVLESALFVYIGPGFQPWADGLVENARSDGSDLEVVRAREGVELIAPPDGEADHDAADHGGSEGDHDAEDDGHESDHGDHGHESNHGDHGHESDAHDRETESDDHDHEKAGEHDQQPESDEHDHVHDDHDHGHDHRDHDPHFWLDPRRTATAVENVRDGVIAIDPENETTYRDRTAGYVDELSALHREFEDALLETRREAVLIAGHNAFRYLERAYDFEIHALTGLSPDAGLSASTRRAAQETIAAHDIEYVLRPVLEPRAPAEALVADTDASGILDITALAGVTEEWIAADRGYIELMREVNLPAFRQALGGQ